MGLPIAGALASAAGGALGGSVNNKRGESPYDQIKNIQIGGINEAAPQYIQGIENARATTEQGFGRSREDLDPFISEGTESMKFFSDLLGVSGDQEATSQAIARYESSPFAQLQKDRLAETEQTLSRQFAGQGSLQSGRFASALQDNAATQTRKGLLDFTNQLGALSSQGLQAATTASGLDTLRTGALSQLDLTQGQAEAERTLGIARAKSDAIANKLGAGTIDPRGEFKGLF